MEANTCQTGCPLEKEALLVREQEVPVEYTVVASDFEAAACTVAAFVVEETVACTVAASVVEEVVAYSAAEEVLGRIAD